MASLRLLPRLQHIRCITRRHLSSHPSPPLDVATLLATPSWCPSSLLVEQSGSSPHQEEAAITPRQLRHLLRLSALPPPVSEAEETSYLSTLAAQLRFVRQMQAVDTKGVEPLRSLRDETEGEVGMEALRAALAGEEVRGVFHQRIRRKDVKEEEEYKTMDGWDVLGGAGRKVGRFFVVEGGKGT